MLGDLNPHEIEALLTNEVVGRIGCHANGVTYVVPITYAYNEGYVYAHSKEGMKIQMMRLNPMVCFEIDNMEDPENWQSVITWGRFEELKGDHRRSGLEKITERLCSRKSSETSMPSLETDAGYQNSMGPYKGIIYRIKLLEKSGKYEMKNTATPFKPPIEKRKPRKLTIKALGYDKGQAGI